jgi:hypothetical protein
MCPGETNPNPYIGRKCAPCIIQQEERSHRLLQLCWGVVWYAGQCGARCLRLAWVPYSVRACWHESCSIVHAHAGTSFGMHQAHPLTAASTVHGALQDGSVCIGAELCAEQVGCHLDRYIPIIYEWHCFPVLLCAQVTSRQHSGPSAAQLQVQSGSGGTSCLLCWHILNTLSLCSIQLLRRQLLCWGRRNQLVSVQQHILWLTVLPALCHQQEGRGGTNLHRVSIHFVSC